jgi:RNA polymerase sporulation-specific sigma factor
VTKQQLIEDNMGLVYMLVNREYPTYIHDEDVIQCGMLGLCIAAEKWDESKSAFSTYAVICIRSAIQFEFRKRAKHQGVLSLDYELKTGNSPCDTTTLADVIVGQEDVPYFDLGVDLTKLTKREQQIAELLLAGLAQSDIAKKLGVSRQYVGKITRKIRTMRGYANEGK